MTFAHAGSLVAVLRPRTVYAVYATGTRTPAALYTDQTMGTSAGSSVASDANGLVVSWAAPGLYDLVEEQGSANRGPFTVSVAVNPLDVGGGGGSPNAAIVRHFPFAFNTAGILTGAALYTPAIGDVLLDAWIEIDTAWNGTTPRGDFGFFHGENFGLLSNFYDVLDMAGADVVFDSSFVVGDRVSSPQSGADITNAIDEGQTQVGANPQPLTFLSPVPAGTRAIGKFTAANPIKIVVSQDGTNTGADPGSTQGAAVLYLVTATPA